ncbi:RING finger protein 222-like [Scleropages formosus]|uniref:RING finger protein 222-like n=1 Tax=Scleropages formosus TaxID=113540 RepID=A0A0P7TTV2_SCLFO|nr:RING finger protein 222-like [Scleropages formosus]
MDARAGHATECDLRDLECPVCYEVFTGSERTLSCGHIFCHDCLVKTLVIASRDGRVARESIICPVCRHVTFIIKGLPLGVTTGKGPEVAQTLEVPVCPAGQAAPSGTHVTTERNFMRSASSALSRICGALRHFSRVSNGVTSPQPGTQSHDSQIFIISNMGRPMTEDDAASAVMTTASEPTARPHSRINAGCTTARFLLILLLFFTVLALIAATLPWVLLS